MFDDRSTAGMYGTNGTVAAEGHLTSRRAGRLIGPVVLVLLAACGPGADVKDDGEVLVPANYTSWAAVRKDIQRPDKNQVRDIYVNAIGAARVEGQPYPDGSQFVMELYSAVAKEDGSLGKGDLSKVFVMTKGLGWGSYAGTPANGDWVYSAYGADKKSPTTDAFSTCRSCHEPHASNDYVIPPTTSP
jgi:hemoglobin